MFKGITLNRAIRRRHDSRLKRKRSRYWDQNITPPFWECRGP